MASGNWPLISRTDVSVGSAPGFGAVPNDFPFGLFASSNGCGCDPTFSYVISTGPRGIRCLCCTIDEKDAADSVRSIGRLTGSSNLGF